MPSPIEVNDVVIEYVEVETGLRYQVYDKRGVWRKRLADGWTEWEEFEPED